MQEEKKYQADILERFIPVSLESLITDLLSSHLLEDEQQEEFKNFCSLYTRLFHAQAHDQLVQVKTLYQPFNPDRDTFINTPENLPEQLESLKHTVFSILENANYEKLSEEDLNEALNKISPYGVKVSVNFEDFETVALFYRGSAVETKWYRNWKTLSLKKQPKEILIYRRLFVLLQPKNRQQWITHFINNKKLSQKKAEKKADAALKVFGMQHKDNFVYLKLFKDIPRADLEMQFPNTRIQMRLFDKIKLMVTGGGGTAGGVMATLGKLSATIDPVSALLALGGLLGVIWRQISKIFYQRAKYSAILTKNLYFYSLDNNMGALTYLSNSAESEECKESILAYFFLLLEHTGIEREALDKRIEQYIKDSYDIPMDFEIEDGLDKLQKANLLASHKGLIQAIPVSQANSRLKMQWNQLINEVDINE